MIGMPPATDASKRDAPPALAGRGEQLRPVFAQQRLVRGDDVLAGFERRVHDPPRRTKPAHQLDDDVHIVRRARRRADRSSPASGRSRHRAAVTDRGPPRGSARPAARAALDAVGVFREQPRHAGADVAQPDQSDAKRGHGRWTIVDGQWTTTDRLAATRSGARWVARPRAAMGVVAWHYAPGSRLCRSCRPQRPITGKRSAPQPSTARTRQSGHSRVKRHGFRRLPSGRDRSNSRAGIGRDRFVQRRRCL